MTLCPLFVMANVLKADLLWIQGRCYRVNDASTEVTGYQEHDLYENGKLQIIYWGNMKFFLRYLTLEICLFK